MVAAESRPMGVVANSTAQGKTAHANAEAGPARQEERSILRGDEEVVVQRPSSTGDRALLVIDLDAVQAAHVDQQAGRRGESGCCRPPPRPTGDTPFSLHQLMQVTISDSSAQRATAAGRIAR